MSDFPDTAQGQATARNVVYHWENSGVTEEIHVAIQREMGLLPTLLGRGDRERHKYLIWLLKNTYEKANYGKPRRRWLQLHSVPRGDRLRNLLATAEPCGYRTKSDGEEDAHVVIEIVVFFAHYCIQSQLLHI